MKRRLNIGIGLLHQPQLLVLDEPTVGVDPQSRNAILEAVDDAAPGRHVHPLHDPLHGGGRAALRPHRHHRRGPHPGRGHARASWSRLVGQLDRVHAHRQRARWPPPPRPSRRSTGCERQRRDGGIEVTAQGARTLLPGIIEDGRDAGATISGVEVAEPDLEAVFLHLTGRALRD